ncbi:putative sodium-dependent transporter YhdH [Lentibacillus sp. JNUCC-1]|nr:putative sodium-dependent transporter YhdH [Lentibacillus sp. JNUCC-1]
MKERTNKVKEGWGSRAGFIMAAAGFSIGLGNIWRFSYVAGNNGGGAFLLIYVVLVVLIGLPLFLAEAGLGRKSQASAITGLRKLTRKGSPWVSIGWLGNITSILITSYYLMIMGWIMAYLFKIGSGSLNGVTSDQAAVVYDSLVSNPLAVIGFTLIPTLIIGLVVSRGVKNGIEKFVKTLMPILLIMMVVLAVFSLAQPGSMEGVLWYLKPDFSKVTAGTLLEALGQVFFSVGIGFAAAFTYGSYLKPDKSDLVKDGAWVIGLDTFIAFISGLVIFPALFAFNMAPDSGPGLLFMSFPALFNQMPMGQLFGFVFFALIMIAALTTGVGLIEAIAHNTSELLGIKRKVSSWVILGFIFLLSIPSILSQGPWSSVQLFGMDIFGLIDYVSGNILLTLGGLLLSLYVVFKWRFKNFLHDINIGTDNLRFPHFGKPVVNIVIPAVIFLILISSAMI